MKRLSKVLSDAGYCSRRKADILIEEGKVKVNGKVILEPFYRVNIENDTVRVNGKSLRLQPKVHAYLVNKPKGFVCSHSKVYKRTIYNLFPEDLPRLFTAGRLDKDTEGLIIVTNDGNLVQKLIHPSSDIQKEYLVKTSGLVTADHLKQISSGVTIEGKHVKPYKVVKVRKCTLKITVKEGKKHEVRLLMKEAGLPVLQLTRIRIGPLHLGKLPPGHYRALSDGEVDDIYSQFKQQ